ncbi:SAM-dependent methyltransferase [Promineifilum sp.]|uniref:class I SAM-dependent methyltransferase n=1 Tax=Promineifilum sp. TaxID=2664178 RepID=UPI0035B3C340
MMSEQNEMALLREAILGDGLVEAVFQGAQRGAAPPWPRVAIRPVRIRQARHLQFAYFDGVQEVAKNYRGEEAGAKLDELLALPFKSIQAITAGETLRVQFSKKGRAILHRERRHQEQTIPLELAHDRAKPSLLPEDEPIPFLQALGVMTADGRVRADQQRKFRQINEFLRLIEETGELAELTERPVRVVDLGCGSAALTFATYYYLNEVRGIPATLTGVDTKAHLLERHRATAERLGWDGMRFQTARIIDYEADAPADIVLALHACDTATDEALARAVRWGSRLIFSAPCCHHHLQAQLAAAETPEPFRPVLRHGILRERLGDTLTDAFRAHILRLLGYRAEVLEFVAVEHTPKNLMIRAVHTGAPALPSLVAEYRAMKAYWGVTPFLEELLRDRLVAVLS